MSEPPCFPRTRGDEPSNGIVLPLFFQFSPHARG